MLRWLGGRQEAASFAQVGSRDHGARAFLRLASESDQPAIETALRDFR
jgi:hypothetical protein